MTQSRHQDAPHDRVREPLDPAALADRDDVAFTERTYTHETTDHCEADAAGRVVVGITDATGSVLLLVNDEASHAILPNCTVDSDDRFRHIARETAEAITGAPVAIGAPKRVRRIEHVTTEGGRHNRTYHVVFAADLDAASKIDPSVDDDTAWEAGWYSELPVAIDDDTGDVLADIQTFIA